MQTAELAEVDRVAPNGPWVFDAEVADCFSDMLRRSIPQYDLMRSLVYSVGRRYVRRALDIVDLGCSRGDAIDLFWQEFGALNRYVLCDTSKPMVDAARRRHKTAIENRLVDVRSIDLREEYPVVRATLTLCVLTLQFTPIEHRPRILRDAYQSTQPGGALILVEKVVGSTSEIDAALVDLHHALKLANGYTRADIDRKRKSLEHVMTPITAAWNEELLQKAGFKHIECFWRSLNFAGWLAIRE